MFSLERCRQILGRDCTLDDVELVTLRDQLYGLADVLTDHLRNQPQFNGKDALEIVEPDVYQAALRLLPEIEREDVEERAAIIEFEGGVERDEAERQAILGSLQTRSEKKNRN